MSAEEVAAAFVPHYYQTLDGNVDALANLFVRNNVLNESNVWRAWFHTERRAPVYLDDISHTLLYLLLFPSYNTSNQRP